MKCFKHPSDVRIFTCSTLGKEKPSVPVCSAGGLRPRPRCPCGNGQGRPPGSTVTSVTPVTPASLCSSDSTHIQTTPPCSKGLQWLVKALHCTGRAGNKTCELSKHCKHGFLTAAPIKAQKTWVLRVYGGLVCMQGNSCSLVHISVPTNNSFLTAALCLYVKQA